MGVPKFFRYISERYPCLSELIRENQVPEFDNLYLDMNGIIHNCSHPNDSDVFFRITEDKIFSDIFHYLEFLFRMIRPQKLFFIAVDGVAPRAKMNQQRGRRFRSAREAQEQAEQAEKKGHVLPIEARFDSNCITPGTSFMVRLQKAMEHFIKVKISTNPLWKHCKVILSGHETPGEGEHKIMEYIRHAKAAPGFDPNTRHCLYGLDADLVMLGLCTHERHFSLLREEVKFGKNEKKCTIVEETRFYLLHLTLMREYLELEFAPVRDKLNFEFNIYKLIDDWVLMGYMVGNDFIPHLPHLHINENALPTLFQAYMDVMPSLDGYINEGGILNLRRLEVFMERLARFDRDIFLEHYTDLKYFKSKRGSDNMEAFDVTIDDIKAEAEMNCDLSALIQASEDMFLDDEEESTSGDIENDPEFFEKEFTAYKKNYYITKMGYQHFNEETRAEQAECYVRALQWTLLYYYRGVSSWSWFYPHHYAPFISDVQHFKHLTIHFEIGKPFLPFQQLLSVLPAASKDHLPTAYHKLMTDPSSPVFDFYPQNFNTDLNGKQQDWEAVVLIPFIDEKRLLRSMEPCDAFLTDEEKQRNVHGPMFQFEYDQAGTTLLPANYGFDDVAQLKVSETHIYRDDLRVAEQKLVLGPSKGCILDGYIKGFPTMKHLQYHGTLKELRIKVFNYPSRKPSMLVIIDRPSDSVKSTEMLAQEMLGRIVYVSWPHLTEAKVVKVVDAAMIYEKDHEPRQNNPTFFDACRKAIIEHNINRLAIDVGKVEQLVAVRTCVGSEYVLRDDRYVLNKLWNVGETMYPVQTVVKDLREVLKTMKPYQEINEMFPENCLVFLRATDWYGSLGHVLDVTAGHKRIKSRFEIHVEPNLDKVVEINEQAKSHYLGIQDAASVIGISPNLLCRLSSTILIVTGGRRSVNVDERGKMNIGLQIRMVTQNEETVGYTKKVDRMWMFSEKAIRLIAEYYEKVPHLFRRLEQYGKCDNLFEDEMLGENNEDGITLKELVAWIKSQDHTKAERRPCGTKILEPTAIEELVKIINESRNKTPLLQTMFVHAKNLYKPGMKQSKSIDHHANFELLDRVIIARETEVVPLGYRGTIVGIHFAKDPNPVRQESVTKEDKYFDILFDKEFPNGVQIFGLEETNNRVVRVAEGAVLNITFGRAEVEYRQVDPSQPIILPAEEFLPNGKPMVKVQQKLEAVRKVPSKPPPTAESIKKRLNERIEKKNPTKAFVMANRKPLEEQETNSQQSACDFEHLWNKLRESAQVSSTLKDRDIKSFVGNSTVLHQQQPQQQQIPLNVVPPVVQHVNSDSSTVKTAADPTNMLKMILKISNEHETDEKKITVLKPVSSVNDLNSPSKAHTTSSAPPQPNIPMPKNLPKPPSSWRSPEKTSCTVQSVTEKQHVNSTNAATLSYTDTTRIQQKTQQPTRPSQPQLHQQSYSQFNQYTNLNMMYPPVPLQGIAPQYQPMPRYQHGPLIAMHPVMHQQQPPLHHQQQAYRGQQYNQRQHGPNGPQNLSFNRNTPAGTGAFVPLQAMRNAKNRNNNYSGNSSIQNKTVINQRQQSSGPITAFAQQNAELRQFVEQQQEEAKQGFASFLSAIQKVSESTNVDDAKTSKSEVKTNEHIQNIKPDAQPPKIRQMRIAAKFSQAE
ncbi:5'-3' exoribonuclease 1 isoform X2 [Topomyia yanbarensis]|uniref:5'-3' exoribonuclease 1 isoform X2 n=1 Tax=Topomyia yanbarensis TaxID=2498891 RepID=UPI00273C7E66|nr:5'-3' exoribonuclease 1 isoform X2 [Topomyia yanbarensis]